MTDIDRDHDISFNREEDDLDIDAIIEMNKDTLPRLPDISTTTGPLKSKMKGLKGNPADDEESRKGMYVLSRNRPGHSMTYRKQPFIILTARQNERLREWLAENGVWMSDKSGWGIPPHPLGKFRSDSAWQ